jgi:hypothetical protein
MTDQWRKVRDREGADRDQRRRRPVPDEEAETLGPARPLEFDANGFPVVQRNPNFVSRVARLLSPT